MEPGVYSLQTRNGEQKGFHAQEPHRVLRFHPQCCEWILIGSIFPSSCLHLSLPHPFTSLSLIITTILSKMLPYLPSKRIQKLTTVHSSTAAIRMGTAVLPCLNDCSRTLTGLPAAPLCLCLHLCLLLCVYLLLV